MTAEQFNELVPVGTPVVYWPTRNNARPWFTGQVSVHTRTRSEAWETGDGYTAIVKVEGQAGGVYIEHVRVDAAKMRRDCEAAIKSQTIKICPLHGAQPCTCQPLRDMDPEPPEITAEQLEAVVDELGVCCYECGQVLQPIPESPPEAEPPTPEPPERHPDCKCEPGGICWACLAKGNY